MNKKTLIIIIILIIAIAITAFLLWKNKDKNAENNVIQPQEETTDEQMRTALVTLYYVNKETKELTPEGRMIDVKNLLTDPYETLVNLLIEQPKNEKLQSAIPNETKVLGAELKGDVVYLDLSNEFIENHEGGEKAEQATIKAIVNTLTELNEVSGVKILINGQENKEFKDGKVEEASASNDNDTLLELIKDLDGMDHLGECAFVDYDSPISNINMIFNSILIDENASCHLALGKGFPGCIPNGELMGDHELLKNGINQSKNHVDFMIGTPDLNITGTDLYGNEVPLFIDGNFATLKVKEFLENRKEK